METRKKMAIIIDVPNWAFHNVANLMKKELQDIIDIDIYAIHVEPYNDDLFMLLEDVKDYDYIHFLWRKNLLSFNSDKFKQDLKSRNINYDEYVDYFSKKITTAVYDHMFLSEEEIKQYADVFNRFSRKYYTSSEKLYKIYCNIPEFKKPETTLIDTFDINTFVPMNTERFDVENISNRPIVIGWVGNSAWNSTDNSNIDYKGLHSILEPVLVELENFGYNIKRVFADKQIKFTPNDQMPDYYKTIDIYITCSYHEGTPRPILEAMSCGVPVIATDVGIVPEVLGDMQKEFIIGDRTILADNIIRDNLKNAIIKLYNNRELFKKLSDENIKRSHLLDSTNFKEPYINFFFK